jgi:hypothetical protein
MHRYAICCALAFLTAAPASAHGQADAPARKLVLETWQAAYFEGARAGHVHTTVHELRRDGARRFLTTRTLRLSIKRYKEVVPVHLEMTTEEKPDGKAVAVSFTQVLGKDRRLTQAGRVEGGKLVVRSNAGGAPARLPWDEEALGLYQQERLFQLRKVKPGDRLTFTSYELALRAALTVRVAVKDLETTDVLVARKDAKGRLQVTRQAVSLQRVEAKPDKVEVGGTTVQLPAQVVWLDRDLLPVRQQAEIPGLGKVTLYQTTREAAEKEGVAPELLPDLGLNTVIAVKQEVERPYETRSAVYRVRFKGEADPSGAFARDARQEARNVKGDTYELHVKAIREPAKLAKATAAGKEYLQSSYFIDSDDARVKALAARVTKGEADPWRKALKVEKWVHDNMKPNNALGFPTAAQVCRDLEGDCRQHAVLTAALCRAAGVPARTAVGVIYAREPGRSPAFVFHMWAEVHVAGQWLGVDATLGQGGVGATHLKIADQSWRDTQTLAPLLPVVRVLGKVAIDVVSAR